jgi:transposase
MLKSTTTSKRQTKLATDCTAVFAGIDYHKRFSVVTLGDADGKVIEQVKLPNEEKKLRQFFRKHSQASCAIESCRGYEWYLQLLTDLGLTVHVANTYAVRLIADSRCKTDKIDSRILMELLAKGFLPTCYQPTEAERQLRERLKWRVSVVRSCTKYKNKAHSLMDKENKPGNLASRKARRDAKYRDDQLSPARQHLLDEHIDVIEYFDKKVTAEDAWIAEIAASSPDAQRLKSIPGIGNVAALMLIAEYGDVSRFKKAKNASAYLGLVPRVYATSDTRRIGRITKTGSGIVRWILVQDAWRAIRECSAFRVRYNSIMKRRGKHIAIVAIARMLAEVAYRVLRDQTNFDETKLALG